MSRWDRFLDNLWQNFDKLLLASLYVMTLGVAVWVSFKSGMDEGTLDWARGSTGNILSGLLGLVGGVAIGKSIRDSKPTTETPPKDQ